MCKRIKLKICGKASEKNSIAGCQQLKQTKDTYLYNFGHIFLISFLSSKCKNSCNCVSMTCRCKFGPGGYVHYIHREKFVTLKSRTINCFDNYTCMYTKFVIFLYSLTLNLSIDNIKTLLLSALRHVKYVLRNVYYM